MVAMKPALVLGILAAVALVGIVFLVVRIVKAKKSGSPVLGALDGSGPLGKLHTLLGNPLVHRLIGHAISTAEATHHAALDAGIVKLIPAAAPFVPVINAAADKVDAAVSAKLGGDPSPAPSVDPGDFGAKIAAVEKLLSDLKSHLGK